MSSFAKGVLTLFGTWLATMIVTGVVSFAILIVLEPKGCAALGRTMTLLWGVIAALFLLSVFVVGVLAWRITTELAGRAMMVFVYGIALIVSFVFIAFAMMVGFNC